MIKINLNTEIKDLEGKPLEVMGKTLAANLVNGAKGDALKLFGWAQSLYKGDELSIDKADFITLMDFVKNSETLTILSKAQILEVLSKCEKNEV